MQELSKFVASGQVLPKFFPHGITKIHLGLKAAGAEIDLDVEGPGTGSNTSLRAARGSSSTASNATPGRLPIIFRRDLYEEGACLEYSWVPEGKRHVMRLEPLQQQDSESDPLDDVSQIGCVQVYRLVSNRVGADSWQFPETASYDSQIVAALVQVSERDMLVVGTVFYADGTSKRTPYPLNKSPLPCPEQPS
jgi:hypothetical protein